METTEEVLCFESSETISNGGGAGENENDGGDGDDTGGQQEEGEGTALQQNGSGDGSSTSGGDKAGEENGLKGSEEENNADVIVLDSDDEDEKKPVLADLNAKLKTAAADSAADEGAEDGPENMADMTVVDEADCSDADSDLDENGESRQWKCSLAQKAPRTYREKDFRPTEKDPRCKPDWPLAAFWPVYVSNFRLFHKFDTDQSCTHAVHKYFAAKGLPSFMVFRWKDTFFSEYQKRVGLYDFLVYFCTEKDANRAQQWCNRESYYGHKLNVYSGRSPDLFSKQKSWRLKHLKAEDKLETETNLEQYLRRYGEVRCVSKQDLEGVLVEFEKTFDDFESMFADDRRIEASQTVGPVSRQRFVEQDVEEEILKALEAKPKMIKTRPRNFLLKSLKHGVIPEMWNLWHKTEAEALLEFKNKRRDNARKGPPARQGKPLPARPGQGPRPQQQQQQRPGAQTARSQKYREKQTSGGGTALREPLPPKPRQRNRSPLPFRSPPNQRRDRSRSDQRGGSGGGRPLDDIDKIIRLKQELADLYARQLDGVGSAGPRNNGPRDGGSSGNRSFPRAQPYHWNKRDDLLDNRRGPGPVGGPRRSNDFNRPGGNNSSFPQRTTTTTTGTTSAGPMTTTGPRPVGADGFPKRVRTRGRKRPRGAGNVGGAAGGATPRVNNA